jgi:hypothetical protein
MPLQLQYSNTAWQSFYGRLKIYISTRNYHRDRDHDRDDRERDHVHLREHCEQCVYLDSLPCESFFYRLQVKQLFN